MKAIEAYTGENSEYFLYTASPLASRLYFWPVGVGHFEYLPGYFLERSGYDNLLFMEIADGHCSVLGEFGSYELAAGSLVIIDCDRPHKYFTKEGWTANWMHINGPLVKEFFKNMQEKFCTTTGDNVVIINTPDTFFNIYNECFLQLKTGKLGEASLSLKINELFIDIINSEPKSLPVEKNEAIIKKVTAYVNNNFTKEITLKDMAKLANLSPYYFNRMFKSYTGYSPYEYVINTRLSHSIYLLKTTRLTIKEICFASGFASESRFCILFKEKFGMSPSTYRSSS